MKVLVLFSGGKDSTYSLWLALQQYEEVKILSVLSKEDSYLYHYQKEKIVRALEEAIDIPITIVTINQQQDELELLTQAVIAMKVEAIVIGGLLSEYQRMKFNEVAARVGIPCFAPLWRKDHTLLLQELQKHFTVIFSTIASMGFSKTDVGRLLDQHMLERIITLNQSSGLSIGGEGGEYESLVLDAPFFKKKIIVEEATVEWDETKFFGYYRIEKLRTEKKV
jgi:ABC transporter with metal-binding/Fe-S-binding domain ATP-binding protein